MKLGSTSHTSKGLLIGTTFCYPTCLFLRMVIYPLVLGLLPFQITKTMNLSVLIKYISFNFCSQLKHVSNRFPVLVSTSCRCIGALVDDYSLLIKTKSSNLAVDVNQSSPCESSLFLQQSLPTRYF